LPVSYAGRTWRVGQSNNAFIFPGVGLGALVAEAREVTDGMCVAAAECLARLVDDADLAAESLYPPIRDLRQVAGRIAESVVRAARDEGVGLKLDDAEIPQAVAAARWEPRYNTEGAAETLRREL
jgi:malate dehydrogenase (oxaloacetate-decarboxylating)